jgi:trans-aconitate methyltransferase
LGFKIKGRVSGENGKNMKTYEASPYDSLKDYSKKALPQRLAGDKLLALANVCQDDVVLDAGCGPGAFSVKIAKKTNHVIGVDLSEKKISEARQYTQNIRNLSFQVSSLYNLRYRNYFTLVFSNSVMHWISKADQKKTLTNFYDMLRPGGRIALQLIGGNPYRGFFHAIFREFFRKYYRYYSRWAPPWFYPKNAATYKRIIEETGFENVQIWLAPEKYLHTVDEAMNFFQSGPLIGYTDKQFFRYDFKGSEYENLIRQIISHFRKMINICAGENGKVEYTYRRIFTIAEKLSR